MSKLKLIAVGGALIVSFPAIAEDELKTYRSFVGYTGLFHTPNAEVLPRGYFDFGYNNQLDFRGQQYIDGHNFVLTAGIYEGLEISGMVASNTMNDNLFSRNIPRPQKRDLSFNFKYQLPLIPQNWFSVAVGAKDIGGAANNYETYYAAASKSWGDFRFSAGIGSNDRPHGQMNGAFAGVEWLPWDWFALQVEHDAEAVNAGARLTIPERWLFDLASVTLTSRFSSSTDIAEDEIFWGININVPFSRQARGLNPYSETTAAAAETPLPVEEMVAERVVSGTASSGTASSDQNSAANNASAIAALSDTSRASSGNAQTSDSEATPSIARTQQRGSTTSYAPEVPGASDESTAREELNIHKNIDYRNALFAQTQSLRSALLNDGFEGVSVGFNQTPHIVVEFENHVFNRNDIDALGMVMGRISEHVYEMGAKFSVQLVTNGLPMLAITGDVGNYRSFINGEAEPNLSVQRGRMAPVSGIAWPGMAGANSPYFKPRLTVGPNLSSRVATELGVLDYSLALDANVQVPMWRGGGLSVSGQAHLTNTDDYDRGSSFARFVQRDGLTHATLYQALELPYGIYYMGHVGFFREFNDFVGVKHEFMWQSRNGRHHLGAEYAYFEYTDFDLWTEYSTASYRYNWVEKDISFHATAGRFFYGDEGAKAETRFWFGDSYVVLFVQSTDVDVAGIGFSIPLSPRKDFRSTRYGQVKGNSAWRHAIGTRIGEDTNDITIGRALQHSTPQDLETTFFNQGRLSPLYVQNNLYRLREVYLTYRGGVN
ncbi:YjbH domain-containing protein [Aliidiomarina iranensis]|uniref:YjbH domain-containing protein n=1 Tax=Aliidiomarina iranensis TaxID=1434071 RepID=UPI001F545148|nr:YjbH domain-containing protein [Aliidiomarina iranensis]